MNLVRLKAGPPIEISAAAIGKCHWLEMQLFHAAGALVTVTEQPELAVVLSEVCQHAAWRANELALRIPPQGALTLKVVSVPPQHPLVAPTDIASVRLALEQLQGRYELLRTELVGPADRAAARTVRQCSEDVTADIAVLVAAVS